VTRPDDPANPPVAADSAPPAAGTPHAGVQDWLDRYLAAWRDYDPAAIGALFTEGATYAFNPSDTGDAVLRGRDAIVANWMQERDPPGSWAAGFAPLVVDGDRAVARGTVRYADGRVFDDLWVLHLVGGRCAGFVEWFMLRPAGNA
jgi:hypothetical protein